MNPDELPMWFAIPASLWLCLVWRRQVVAARRASMPEPNEQEQSNGR